MYVKILCLSRSFHIHEYRMFSWRGVCGSVPKLRGSGICSTRKILKFTTSEVASEPYSMYYLAISLTLIICIKFNGDVYMHGHT